MRKSESIFYIFRALSPLASRCASHHPQISFKSFSRCHRFVHGGTGVPIIMCNVCFILLIQVIIYVCRCPKDKSFLFNWTTCSYYCALELDGIDGRNWVSKLKSTKKNFYLQKSEIYLTHVNCDDTQPLSCDKQQNCNLTQNFQATVSSYFPSKKDRHPTSHNIKLKMLLLQNFICSRRK